MRGKGQVWGHMVTMCGSRGACVEMRRVTGQNCFCEHEKKTRF